MLWKSSQCGLLASWSSCNRGIAGLPNCVCPSATANSKTRGLDQDHYLPWNPPFLLLYFWFLRRIEFWLDAVACEVESSGLSCRSGDLRSSITPMFALWSGLYQFGVATFSGFSPFVFLLFEKSGNKELSGRSIYAWRRLDRGVRIAAGPHGVHVKST